MAGMPQRVVERADEILHNLEQVYGTNEIVPSRSPKDRKKRPSVAEADSQMGTGAMQLTMFQLDDPVLVQIRDQIKGLGHGVSEEAGMRVFADLLQERFPELEVIFLHNLPLFSYTDTGKRPWTVWRSRSITGSVSLRKAPRPRARSPGDPSCALPYWKTRQTSLSCRHPSFGKNSPASSRPPSWILCGIIPAIRNWWSWFRDSPCDPLAPKYSPFAP